MTTSSSVLIDQTLLWEAARALDQHPNGGEYAGSPIYRLDAPELAPYSPLVGVAFSDVNYLIERLANLSALLDALLLYDELLTLPCEQPTDAEDLPLIRALFNTGVVREMEINTLAPSIAYEMGDCSGLSRPTTLLSQIS